MSEFRMPLLGADMEAGTLIEWVRRPGDRIRRGDIVAVVDTDKGAIEIEAYEDGVLGRIHVEPGQKVPVGTLLATIDGAAPGRADERPSPEAPAIPHTAAPPPAAPTGLSRPPVSPAARQAARALNVDISNLTGTGPGGAVTLADVQQAARPMSAVSATADRAAGMRAAIGAAMARSKREIPHFYLATTIDAARLLQWLGAENERRPVTARLLPIAALVKSVARALVAVPELNGFWIDGTFQPGAGIHVGCAIALRGGGLVAPAVHDADRKDLATLMAELRDLVGRARRGSLRSSELADPTITVTNLGDLGVDSAFGIIYPPQVALVGSGRIAERPWVVGGAVVARPTLVATLSADHRAVDGHRAGVFLATIDRLLQEPQAL